MDQLNSKLITKYNNLKKRKALIEADHFNTDIAEFENAVEVVQELKSENDRLRGEVRELQEESERYQDLMIEECRKTKQLSDEVERLQNLLSERNISKESAERCPPSKDSTEKNSSKDSPIQKTPQTTRKITSSTTKSPRSKSTPDTVTRNNQVLNEEPINVSKDSQTKVLVPDCCKGSTISSGEVQGICVFQTLLELLLGVQFSVDSQIEGPRLSAVHQMSGYTFTLTWLRRADGDGEFRYHVSSLGTLERVALEWMKEDIIFSRNMWPVFFERMSRAIGCR